MSDEEPDALDALDALHRRLVAELHRPTPTPPPQFPWWLRLADQGDNR